MNSFDRGLVVFLGFLAAILILIGSIFIAGICHASEPENFTIAIETMPLKSNHDTELTYLLTVNDPKNGIVFAVKPDGTVLIRGKEIEQMSTEEARVAMVLLSRYILVVQEDSNLSLHMSRQTDYLIQRIQECERKCP